MQINEQDISYLLDILECINDIISFTSNISFNDFERDKMRKLAVERQLEIIGQAANKITKETQNKFKTIPWRQIIGLRNRLAHDYGEILAKRIFNISQDSLLSLQQEIEKIEQIKKYL
jgi:uncharacterized protein with HEPN domain